MAQRAGRITCARCGANNFDTVTSCWKCGAPVGVAPTAAAGFGPSPLPPASISPMPAMQERMPAHAAYSALPPSGDAAVARRAAILLGLTIPFIGLPVGWVFMMIEDRSKQAVGRWCATWSMIGLVIHLVVTYLVIQQSVPMMLRMLTPVLEGAARRNAGGQEGMPASSGQP